MVDKIGKLVWFVLVYQSILTFLIGTNVFSFATNLKDFKELVVGIFIQNIAQIIGLGVIVAKFLYPNNEIKKALS